MHLDSRSYLFVLFILVFSVYLAFSGPAISESGYKELLLLKIGSQYLDFIKIIIPLLSFASSALIFRAFKPDNTMVAFLVSLLFLFSPLVLSNISYSYSLVAAITVLLFALACFLFFHCSGYNARYVAIVPLLIGVYLIYAYLDFSFSLAKLKEVGLVLPLAAISIILVIRDKIDESVVLLILGLCSSLFLPAAGLVFLSFSALLSLNAFLKDINNALYWAIFVLFLAFYLFFNPVTETYLNVAGVSLALSLVVYFLLPLFDLSKATGAFAVFLAILGFTNSMLLLEQSDLEILGIEEFGIFHSASNLKGVFGVLDHRYAFEYYTGNKPELLKAEDLLERKDLDVNYVILTAGGLEKVLGSRPVIFRLYSASLDNGQYSADFVSSSHLLRVTLSMESGILGDGLLFDRQGGQARTVSFPKLKPFNTGIQVLDGGLLINTENILDTNLYAMLFTNPVLSEARGVKLIKLGE